jgi:hypothetical protein
MLSLPSQVAQTPELTKVFCFFSSEKKTFLTFAPVRAGMFPLPACPVWLPHRVCGGGGTWHPAWLPKLNQY